MSTEIQTTVKVDTSLERTGRKRQRDILHHKRPMHPSHKKHKPEENRNFRCCRKRSYSFAGNAKFFAPHKKRKQVIPPTKFLLGGNINDPLNLNSLQDEEINRAMNAVTPESSPLPTPKHRKGEVEVIIPPNINDPLNLAGCEQEDSDAYAALLITPVRKVRKKHKKKRQRSSHGSLKEETPDIVKSDESKTDTLEADLSVEEVPQVEETNKESEVPGDTKKEPVKPMSLDISSSTPTKDFKKPKRDEKDASNVQRGAVRKFDSKDKIVSPVVPQPGAWSATHRFRQLPQQRPNQATPKFKEQDKQFQYGNYNRYYGYRVGGHEVDPRLKVLGLRRELFEGRDVLDLGCNCGHVTLSVARDLGARTVVGLDVDRTLIETARANVRRFAASKDFPLSMPVLYGSLDVPGVPTNKAFPHNVSFVQGNYVLQSDVLVELEQPQFDVILCLSVTKWLHLNWGDSGLKRAFKRMYAQLRPGGYLILEPQPWSSYKKKKTLTETIWKNYQSIKLFPTMFTQFLLTEVGFSKCEVMGAPLHHSRGFQRPIKVFTKGESPASPRTPATNESEAVSKSTKSEALPIEPGKPCTSTDVPQIPSDTSTSESLIRCATNNAVISCINNNKIIDSNADKMVICDKSSESSHGENTVSGRNAQLNVHTEDTVGNNNLDTSLGDERTDVKSENTVRTFSNDIERRVTTDDDSVWACVNAKRLLRTDVNRCKPDTPKSSPSLEGKVAQQELR